MVVQVRLNDAEQATILPASFINPYTESVKEKCPGSLKYDLLNVGASNLGEFVGSSTLIQAYLANSGLLPKDAHLATKSELERACALSQGFFQGGITGLTTGFGVFLPTALISDSDPLFNFYEQLRKQVEAKGVSIGDGKVIPNTALRVDRESLLGIRLREDADVGTFVELKDFSGVSPSQHVKTVTATKHGYLKQLVWTFAPLSIRSSWQYDRIVVVSGNESASRFLLDYVAHFNKAEREEIDAVRAKYVTLANDLLDRQS